ncbi:hypothetical protein F01_490126 [Burkholderia cenocepacia]|nr:hypothetical protein F01_490126 [Burkholderia cenocepacia]
MYRGFAGAEHVQIGSGQHRGSWQECTDQVRPEQGHPRSGLVRVPSPTGLQAGMERRQAYCGAAREHEPDVSGVRLRERGEPAYAGAVRLYRMRFRGKRRRGRRDQCFGAGTPRCSLWRAGAVGPLREAGTRRGDLKQASSF